MSKDPLWSGTLADVPSTPDENLARDNAEKNTIKSREDIMALALAKIAGLPVAEFLGPMIGQAADRGTVLCISGHENFPQSKFCAECGAPMNVMAAEADVVEDASSAPAALTPPPPPKPRVPQQPATKSVARRLATR